MRNNELFDASSWWHMEGAVIVNGDFNSIRKTSERAGRRAQSCRRDVEAFDSFVRDLGLIDLPLHGRLFTWYMPDGSCKSRLDRFLINNRWISKWPNSAQVGLQRSLSDHCPILLEIKVKDSGPKPFRCINAWMSFLGFKDFIRDKWNNYEVEGWGGYIIKEKFKKLKADLKMWNQDVFGFIEKRI
ncbi:hypothetical protein ACS0TY_033995 [Phlomoides rotata]